MTVDTLEAPRPLVPGAALGAPIRQVDRVGGTPLVDLSHLTGSPVGLFAKAEMANPGGSVKDRPALSMIRAAERSGLLVPGKRILDATSGNTGIALAMVGAARGYPVTLALPANASPERRRILAAYGAEVVLTDPLESSDGAIREARRMADRQPELYVYLDQYGNPENPLAHYRTTGPEIWNQTGGRITHFVTGLGTSGTFMGVGGYLRNKNPQIRLISMEPDSPMHGLEGLKHMASAIVPNIYDSALADEARVVSTEKAYDMVKHLARKLGLLVGISSGANVAAALEVASELEEGVVVTVLCDGAEKYLSENFWEAP